jgi:hypothetical protein
MDCLIDIHRFSVSEGSRLGLSESSILHLLIIDGLAEETKASGIESTKESIDASLHSETFFAALRIISTA